MSIRTSACSSSNRNAASVRAVAVFALFEGGMPAIGVLVGGPFSQVLGATADYVAIAILLGFGAFTLVHGDADEEEASRFVSARGPALILIGLSVSLMSSRSASRSGSWGCQSRVSTLAQAGRSRVGPEPDLSIPALTTGRASREERRDEEDEQSNKAWPTCHGYREGAHWILLFVGPALSGTP
jgi:hypothetical protein